MFRKFSVAILALSLVGAPTYLIAQDEAEEAQETQQAEQQEEKKEEELEMGKRPVVGDVFENFTGTTYDGQEVSLTDYRGKLTLVDFWATWCGPCLAELPYVRTAYKDLHDKGFDIVAVSLDREKEPLQKFYEDPETTLPWKSISDFEGWRSEYAAKYGIRSIPATFLLDEEGVVIATDLRGNDLYRAVAERIAPGMEPEPDLHDLMVKYDENPDMRKELHPQIIEKAKANYRLAGGVAWMYLDDDSVEKTKEKSQLIYEILDASMPEDAGYGDQDTFALAAYVAGHPEKAVELQQKAVDGLVKRMEERDMSSEDIAKHPYTVEFSTRLALYKASAGNIEGAQAKLQELEKVSEGKVAEDKYFKQAQEIVEKSLKKS